MTLPASGSWVGGCASAQAPFGPEMSTPPTHPCEVGPGPLACHLTMGDADWASHSWELCTLEAICHEKQGPAQAG